jgi:hypothetical protein
VENEATSNDRASLLERAKEAQSIGETMGQPGERLQMLKLAETYRRLAAYALRWGNWALQQ